MAAQYAGKYIDSAQLKARLNPTTYKAIFDDENTNDEANVSLAAITLVIDSAEGEVDSYLITEMALPLPTLSNPAKDRLVQLCCLDFAQALSLERHAEYTRTFGQDSKKYSMWQRAEKRMDRIQDARQQLPDVAIQTGGKPANTGGVVYDNAPRVLVDSPDGTTNGGDF